MATANIFQQYLRPPKSAAEYGAEMDVREANQLELAAKRQAVADEAALRQAYQQSGGDPNKIRQALLGSGNVKALTAFDAAQLSQQKTQGDINKQKIDLVDAKLKQSRNYLDTVQTPEQYIAWHEANHSDPILGPELRSRGVTAEQARSSIMQALQKPGGFEDMLNKSKLGIEKFTEMNKPHFTTQNLGGTSRITSMPGLGGAPTILSETPITQSADSIAAAASAAASRAQAERASTRADTRAREATAAMVGKPFEVTGPDGQPILVQQDKQGNIRPVQGYSPKTAAEKPLTEGQSKALLFGARMEAADKILGDLSAKGTTTSVPGSNVGYGVGRVITAMSSADQQKLDQAKRDFINATLRRESGAVISPSEFENAEMQYFPQVGDSKKVIEQKAQNRLTATRGVQVEVPKAQRGLIKEVQAPKAADIHSQAEAILRGK